MIDKFLGLAAICVPASLQARLLALLMIAGAPITVLGGWVAWQNYLGLIDLPTRRVESVHGAMTARYDTITFDLSHLLENLSHDDRLLAGDAALCDQALQQFYRIEYTQFKSISLLSETGAVRCTASDKPPGDLALGQKIIARLRLVEPTGLVLLEPDPTTGRSTLLSAVKLTGAGGGGGTLVARLRTEWLSPQGNAGEDGQAASAWLLDYSGAQLPIGIVDEAALPSNESVQRIMASSVPLIAATASGAAYAYEASTLSSGLRLLVATRADGEIAFAQRRLGTRLAEFGVLLVGGLIAVAFGANITVVEPLKRLSLSVQRWRAGGMFDVALPKQSPAEFRELARSFSQAAASLAEREKQLRAASTQQDLLMQEIHHRVKNNLQIIASLLNLQASRIRQPQAKAEFQSARDRIRALATLHRHLYAHNELHTINMRSFLNELCGQLVAAIGDRPGDRVGAHAGNRRSEIAPERIILEIDAPELQISSDQAVPIALIVTEAVSNAAKYAFPNGRTGHISVKLTTGSDEHGDRALLQIRDDGVGIPAGRAETETGIRDGIGIQLIRGFARQLGATLKVTENLGTSYEIDIPLRRSRDTTAEPAELAADT